jgi:mRNA interferase RelE/StbE
LLEIKYSEKAVRQIKKIMSDNPGMVERILSGIEQYAITPAGVHDIKYLKGKLAEFRRLRVGSFRVIFDIDNQVMYVYEVKHRKDAYND